MSPVRFLLTVVIQRHSTRSQQSANQERGVLLHGRLLRRRRNAVFGCARHGVGLRSWSLSSPSNVCQHAAGGSRLQKRHTALDGTPPRPRPMRHRWRCGDDGLNQASPSKLALVPSLVRCQRSVVIKNHAQGPDSQASTYLSHSTTSLA